MGGHNGQICLGGRHTIRDTNSESKMKISGRVDDVNECKHFIEVDNECQSKNWNKLENVVDTTNVLSIAFQTYVSLSSTFHSIFSNSSLGFAFVSRFFHFHRHWSIFRKWEN